METVAETKLLSFNQLKSVFMVVGNNSNKKKLLNEIERNPLTLCGKQMMRAEDYVYLGTVISDRGVSDSAALSVRRKIGRVKHMIYEIKSVIDDFRNRQKGSFCTAVQIWEMAVVPHLYYASECWIDVSNTTLKILNNLEETFYLSILSAPRSCPKPGIYWEVGGKTPENRIIENKILFYFHLINLDDQSLAKKIIIQEQKLNVEGYYRECQLYFAQLDINPEMAKVLNKKQWKDLVSRKIKLKTENDILERAKSYKIFFF